MLTDTGASMNLSLSKVPDGAQSKYVESGPTISWANSRCESGISIIGMSFETELGKVGMVQNVGDMGDTKDAPIH